MEDQITEAAPPSVRIVDLSVRFSGRTILDKINLLLYPGELTMIVGPSGSGKSTLLRSINRLNELFPGCRTDGSVEVGLDGRKGNVYEDFLPLPELRRKIGMVFQTPTVLPFSIRKNIVMPLRVALGLSGTALTERLEWCLREVALWDEVKDRLHESASTLSGGQQQRLCLARVLALDPQVLLLDEPTASLDYQATRKIEGLLARLKERYTVLAVSHSLGQTRRLADRIYVLKEGTVAREADRGRLQDGEVFQRFIDDIF